MSNDLFKSAIKTLTECFGIGNCWAITGSTNLAIREAELEPFDIDIITVRSLADLVSQSSNGNIDLKFSFSCSETIKSYYARTIIFGIPIEVMADVEILTKSNVWQKIKINHDQIELNHDIGFTTQLTSLSYERVVYSLLNDQVRLGVIDMIDTSRS